MTIDHLRSALKSASRYAQEQVCQLKSCSAQPAIKNNDLVGCNENQNDPFLTKINSNSRVNRPNCELGILANVKLPATSEYPTLSI